MKTAVLAVATLVHSAAVALASQPADRVNFQGVLRSSAGAPLTGTYDVTFHLHDSMAGGTLIVTDSHTTGNGNPVTVTGGLFNTQLGQVLSGGLGYTTLRDVFRDYGTVFVQVQVAGETLVPRIAVAAAPHALNCENANLLDGQDATAFAAASHVHAALTGGAGLTGGPYDGSGAVTLDVGAGNGIQATAGAVGLGQLTADWSQRGPYDVVLDDVASELRILGSAGGTFYGTLDAGALAANATYTLSGASGTVWTSGNDGAGSGLAADTVDGIDGAAFLRSDVADTAAGRITFTGDPTGTTVGLGSVYVNPAAPTANETLIGVASNGTQRFRIDNEGDTSVAGYLDVEGNLTAGNSATPISTNAIVGEMAIPTGCTGVRGVATATGTSGAPNVYGVFGSGSATGVGNLAAVIGVRGVATGGGGYSHGVFGTGTTGGGWFQDSDSGASADVAYSTMKITGSGSVAFVQNHPVDPSKVIVYNCPEGDEVATYTRGSARLAAGEARVRLGETFAWVTNPDIGLTAHVTPRGVAADLYVASVTPSELLVRSRDGAGDASFDYVVYGLRIGFEEVSIVQEKRREARIPSMADHRERYAADPELRRYSALERFKVMRADVGDGSPLDLSRSRALHDAVTEFDPAVHAADLAGAGASSSSPERQSAAPAVVAPTGDPRRPSEEVRMAKPASHGGAAGSAGDRDVYGRSFRADLSELAQLVPVSGPVQVGDVLVVDPTDPGRVRTCDRPADGAVVGIVAGEPGVALEGGMARIAEADPALASDLEAARARGDQAAAEHLWQELLGKFREANVPMALSGMTRCRVDARGASIAVGDLLVSSATPGHAMKGADPAPGTVVAKALERLDGGTGLIRVLVMAR